MAKDGTLLVVDDNRNILAALRLLLEKEFARVITLASPNGIASVLRTEEVDAVLLDMNFTAAIQTGNEGIYWLRQILQLKPALGVVVFTAYGEIDLAVRAIQSGAADFVVKPWDNERLIASLRSACDRSKRGSGRRTPRAAGPEETMFWGESPEMLRVREWVEKAAPTEANILLTGENGTGKEMLAREIHRLSSRAARPMVSVDVGSIPETLFESELFGHVKGAFTDARADRTGKFEEADGTTLFLDEIGNIPLRLQPKLLTALQRKHIVRIGSNEERPVDIRLIAATNEDLAERLREGSFREDLYYRIDTLRIDLPPLRRRREDILPLAALFLERYAEKYGKPATGFAEDAVRELERHPWPGNVRELQHTVEKAVILCDGTQITAALLQLGAAPKRPATEQVTTLEEMEREMIAQAIARLDGNLSAVAQQLGITRQTLYNKIKRYGL